MWWTSRVALSIAVLACGIGASACGEPPAKEMYQAQGAIDAARAAGAAEYAPEELAAADAALTRAREAASQRDYRLALNNALDARDRAHNAAKSAAIKRAALRGDVERAIAEVALAVEQLQGRLKAAEGARVPLRQLAGAHEIARAAQTAVQEARTALSRDEHTKARRLMADISAHVASSRRSVDAAIAARAPRRRR